MFVKENPDRKESSKFILVKHTTGPINLTVVLEYSQWIFLSVNINYTKWYLLAIIFETEVEVS